MTSPVASSFSPQILTTLAAAARDRAQPQQRPSGKAVTAALLAAEKTAKQQRLILPPEALYGTWRLCFSAPRKPHYHAGEPVGNGFYVPALAVAQISFQPAAGRLAIDNQLQVGPLTVAFAGPAKALGRQNLLAFDFNQLAVKLFGAQLYSGAVRSQAAKSGPFEAAPIGKLPFFAFFLAEPGYIAARGRGGGLALWAQP
jgi:hypothetical protein